MSAWGPNIPSVSGETGLLVNEEKFTGSYQGGNWAEVGDVAFILFELQHNPNTESGTVSIKFAVSNIAGTEGDTPIRYLYKENYRTGTLELLVIEYETPSGDEGFAFALENQGWRFIRPYFKVETPGVNAGDFSLWITGSNWPPSSSDN